MGHFRNQYLPPVPDRLFKALGARSVKRMDEVYEAAEHLLRVLQRMSEDERSLLYYFFRDACPAELPKNVHINIDLLRRVSGFPYNKIRRLLGGLSSLGFSTTTMAHEHPPGELGRSEMLVLEWNDFSFSGPESTTDIASAMIRGSGIGYCEEHGRMAWERLDFSQLASSTAVIDKHPKAPRKHKRGS